eukprot:GHVT01090436.1.p1 GENE.GHVT01090436.1~~GHVT01090436.1.p1  ORF type:complete len:170 (-),score=41.57 GHVT01090436.1:811-1320(-)
MLSNTLKKDIQTSSGGAILAASLHSSRATVDGLIRHELLDDGVAQVRKNKRSGVVSLLWMKRALHFILTFLEKTILSGAHRSAYENAREAYEFVLKPYHGWLVANVVVVAFNLCPTKEQLCKKLGFHDMEDCRVKVRSLLEVASPIIEEVDALLLQHECNFPDKASLTG